MAGYYYCCSCSLLLLSVSFLSAHCKGPQVPVKIKRCVPGARPLTGERIGAETGVPCARCSGCCSSRFQLQRKEREACIPTWTCSCRYCICDRPCPHPLQQELVSTPRLSHYDRDACGSEPLSLVCTPGLRGRGGHPALTPQDSEFRKHGEQLLSQPCLPQ